MGPAENAIAIRLTLSAFMCSASFPRKQHATSLVLTVRCPGVAAPGTAQPELKVSARLSADVTRSVRPDHNSVE